MPERWLEPALPALPCLPLQVMEVKQLGAAGFVVQTRCTSEGVSGRACWERAGSGAGVGVRTSGAERAAQLGRAGRVPYPLFGPVQGARRLEGRIHLSAPRGLAC